MHVSEDLADVVFIGQSKAWKKHHRRICKDLPAFLNTTTDTQQRLDCLLIAQLAAKHLSSEEGRGAIIRYFQSTSTKPSPSDLDDPLRALFTLLPSARLAAPKLPLSKELLDATPKAALDYLLSTIKNNHFCVATMSLQPIANAIFPIASRAFNHSCVPNAATAYVYKGGAIIQDIRALKDIEVGEEVREYFCVSLGKADHEFTLADHNLLRRPSVFIFIAPEYVAADLWLRMHVSSMRATINGSHSNGGAFGNCSPRMGIL